ncbi:MAG: zinc ribbon domain-containing protein [Promethearchaeota archaeon]|nr:MAG: zinc ribbon domain-containing protein [Candidatus Lokiarchaeota archaeon]
MLCLIPMAWISFSFLNLAGGVTGGLIEGLELALADLGSIIPGIGGFLSIIGGAFIGLILIFIFPIHWCLFYRPDDVLLIIAVIVPWILCCTITSALFAHSPRGGIHTSLAIGIGYMIPAVLIYLVIPALLESFLPGGGAIGTGVLDGLAEGLTDLPYLLAVLTAILEGSLVGAVFGGFIGSLKYKPGGKAGKVKTKKVKAVSTSDDEPTLEQQAGVDYCTNCGAKLTPGDDFCTNCGQKRPNIK